MPITNTVPAESQIPVVSVAELEADPHTVFRTFRPSFPFIRRSDGVAIVLRAEDVRSLATSPSVRSVETEFIRSRDISEGPLFRLFAEGMLNSNGDIHRARRRPFARTFSFRLIAALRPKIREAADALIDGFEARGRGDLLREFASPLPARTIAATLGLPAADVPKFTKLVYSVARVLSFAFTPKDLPKMQDHAAQLLAYVDDVLSARRSRPGDDFLTSYLAGVDDGGDLCPSEVIVRIAILIIGGSDTTRAALASMFSLLLRHDQYAAVCSDPSLVSAAVSESLRYEPSVGSIGRFTLEDIEIDGRILAANQLVSLSTISAMRDEKQFQRPDMFDIQRDDSQRSLMVFGGGAHRCLGEALAMAELEEGLAAMTARLPGLRLVGDPPKMQGHFGIRHIGPLRVEWLSYASGQSHLG